MKLDKFTMAYITCALWSSTNENDEPLHDKYNIEDISEECLTLMIKDCQKFQTDNFEMIKHDLAQAGHDFWLTRNGHCAGFWDGDWPEFGDILTAKCKEFKTVDLYVGDNGKIYCL